MVFLSSILPDVRSCFCRLAVSLSGLLWLPATEVTACSQLFHEISHYIILCWQNVTRWANLLQITMLLSLTLKPSWRLRIKWIRVESWQQPSCCYCWGFITNNRLGVPLTSASTRSWSMDFQRSSNLQCRIWGILVARGWKYASPICKAGTEDLWRNLGGSHPHSAVSPTCMYPGCSRACKGNNTNDVHLAIRYQKKTLTS